MSGFLFDAITDEAGAERRLTGNAWFGFVATPADDMGDRIYVTIPGLSATNRVGPCRWQSRDDTSLPARGDTCLVLYDDQGDPWVAAWWPFIT